MANWHVFRIGFLIFLGKEFRMPAENFCWTRGWGTMSYDIGQWECSIRSGTDRLNKKDADESIEANCLKDEMRKSLQEAISRNEQKYLCNIAGCNVMGQKDTVNDQAGVF